MNKALGDRVEAYFDNLRSSVMDWINEGHNVHVEQQSTFNELRNGDGAFVEAVVDGFIVTIYGGRPASERKDKFGISYTSE